MTLPCACWLLKQKRHGRKIKKIEKTWVSFKPFFLNFYTLNGYKFYRKKLLDKTKKLGRVFYIINLSAFIDSCKCVDKRNDCQLNSGIKRCKTKIFLPICLNYLFCMYTQELSNVYLCITISIEWIGNKKYIQ